MITSIAGALAALQAIQPVESALMAIIQKLSADASADVAQENANLAASHAAMISAVDGVDAIANS